MPDSRGPLVLVSNRGPVTFQDDGSVKRGTGGLVTALTGLASRSRLAGGTNPHARLGTTSVVSMFSGALVGAVLVLHAGATWSLSAAAGIVAVTAIYFARTVPLEVSEP